MKAGILLLIHHVLSYFLCFSNDFFFLTSISFSSYWACVNFLAVRELCWIVWWLNYTSWTVTFLLGTIYLGLIWMFYSIELRWQKCVIYPLVHLHTSKALINRLNKGVIDGRYHFQLQFAKSIRSSWCINRRCGCTIIGRGMLLFQQLVIQLSSRILTSIYVNHYK